MRVIEVSAGPAAAFAGRLLSQLGGEVIAVRSPYGHPHFDSRSDLVDDETALYCDQGKLIEHIDLRRRSGTDSVLRLIEGADALVEDLGPGGLARLRLSYPRLRRVRPRIVVASISPFGWQGPRAGWEASELVVQAMAGVVHSTGWDAEAPLKLAGHPAHFVAGLHAATAILAGVHGIASAQESGVHIDISMEEAFVHHWTRHIAQWAYSGTGTRRERRTFGRQGFPHTVTAADGWLYILALYAEWEELAFFLGLEPFITHEWTEPRVRAERWPEIEPHFYESIAARSKYDWFADAAERGYTFAPIESVLDLLDSPQFDARRFFEQALVDGESVPCPGLPFPWESVGRPDPRPADQRKDMS